MVRQQYTGDGSTTVYSVSGGYSSNNLDVYVNGVKVRNGTDVVITNGSSFTFTVAPPNGALIDVVGSTTNPAYVNVDAQYTWSNTQTFSNTITFTQTIIGTANNASYLGTVAAASYLTNTGTYTISGVHTHTANLVLSGGLSANGGYGTTGQVLTSNGTTGSPYWSTVSGVNVAAQYAWTNVHTYSSNLQILSGGKLIVNSGAQIIDSTGSQGSAGYVLTSNGSSNVYWATAAPGTNVSAQYAWTNTQSFSNTITFNGSIVSTNTISANGSTGTAGFVLTSAGASSNVYWAQVTGAPTMVVVSGTTQTATINNRYVLTNAAATTVTLPASPTAGDTLYIVVANGLATNVVARNGNKIMSLSEDLTLDVNYYSLGLMYVNSTLGWVII